MSELETARGIGVPQYFVKHYTEFRSNFDTAHIERNFEALLEADTVLKSTLCDTHLVLDLLILSLIQPSVESQSVAL